LVTSNIIQSVCLVGKGRLKEMCGLEPRTNIFFRLRNRQKLVRIRSGCGLDSRMYGIFRIIPFFEWKKVTKMSEPLFLGVYARACLSMTVCVLPRKLFFLKKLTISLSTWCDYYAFSFHPNNWLYPLCTRQ